MIEIDEWFKPEKLLSLSRRYWFIAFVIVYLPSAVGPFFDSLWAGVGAAASATLVFGFLYWWIGAFYETAYYRVTESDIEYKRGVWFKQRTEVPYNRITNISAKQGPVQRSVGCGQVNIQTAGSSDKSGPELKIKGVEDYERIRAEIVNRIKDSKPSTAGETFAVEDEVSRNRADEILEELKKIRSIIEKK